MDSTIKKYLQHEIIFYAIFAKERVTAGLEIMYVSYWEYLILEILNHNIFPSMI